MADKKCFEVVFDVPEELLYHDYCSGAVVRKWFTSRGDGDLPKSLFWRDEDGETLNDFSSVRWGGGMGIGRVMAIGDAYQSDLLAATPAMLSILADSLGRVPKLEIKRHNVFARIASRPWVYTIRDLVFTKTPQDWDEFMKADAPARARIITTVIKDSFTGIGKLNSRQALFSDTKESKNQCESIGVDTPDGFFIKLDPECVKDEVNIRPVRVAGIDNDEAGSSLTLRRASFASNLRLSPVGWAAGRLAHKGFGYIGRARMSEEAAKKMIRQATAGARQRFGPARIGADGRITVDA